MARLLDGRRQQQLQQSWDAHWHGELRRRREQLAHGVPLATRDVADVAEIGLELINPWDVP